MIILHSNSVVQIKFPENHYLGISKAAIGWQGLRRKQNKTW
jgi:hypothetical protein